MTALSIITINFNDAAGLERTIRSVAEQSVKEHELIVIDGGSSDGSTDVIKKYESSISSWVSEKDQGIYDAQNKGISRSKGKYLLFLNAGDHFHDKDVERDFLNFITSGEKKLIYGSARIIDADGAERITSPPAVPDLDFWYANTITHQAVFFHSDLFSALGKFKTEYRFGADYDFLLRVFLAMPAEFKKMNRIICDYDNTGLTSKDEYHKMIIEERKKIMLTHVSKSEFRSMRSHYLAALPFKRRYTVIIRENPLLRNLLRPFYKLFFR
ncbi:MAG: glycosyltransferase family 2 protein [Bacteroidia bacterium]